MYENGLNLTVTNSMRDSLLSAMSWLKFLTILAAIGAGFLAIAGVGMILFSFVEFSPMILAGFVYLIMAGLYIYPVKKSFNLISNTHNAMAGDQNSFEEAAHNFKSIMKFFGIMTIAVFVLYIVIIIIAVVAGVTASMF